MSLRFLDGLLALTLSAGFAVPGTAQEVLPFSPNRLAAQPRGPCGVNLQSALTGESSAEGCAEHSHRAHR